MRQRLYLLENMDLSALPSWVGHDYEKIEVEQTIMQDPDISGTVLRLPMIYGPGDIQKRFLTFLNGKRMTKKFYWMIKQRNLDWADGAM